MSTQDSSQQAPKKNIASLCRHYLSIFATLFTFFSIVSFADYLYDFRTLRTVSDFRELFHHLAQPTREPWKPLALELQMYIESGYSLAWLNWKFLQVVRGQLFPFSQFLDLWILRVFGILQILVPLILAASGCLCAGMMNHHSKRATFQNISSTKLHIMKHLFAGFSCVFASVYLAFPFGTELPIVGLTIPILSTYSFFGLEFSIWYSNPAIAFYILTLLTGSIAYEIGSHLTFEI